MKQFSSSTRLAELDLEEAIIREGYMAGVRGMFARIIAERLCEIHEERTFIMGLTALEHAPDAPIKDRSVGQGIE